MEWCFFRANKKASFEAFLRLPLRAIHLRQCGLSALSSSRQENSRVFCYMTMPTPGKHKTVQVSILHYAQEIGWTYLPRDEAERRRNFDPDRASPAERASKPSLFFGGPGRQLMTAQPRVHALDLPERTSFTVKNAR